MFHCPKCNISLKKSAGQFGVFWLCPACSGKAVSLSILRRFIPVPIVNEFWSRVKSKEFPEKKECPACNLLMSEVPIKQADKTIYIDICKKCYFIWFDANEFESLPRSEVYEVKAEEQLPLKAREALAKLEIEFLAKKQRQEDAVNEGRWQQNKDLLIDTALYMVFNLL
jgi:Zn-finger nucleic acid-binding protein